MKFSDLPKYQKKWKGFGTILNLTFQVNKVFLSEIVFPHPLQQKIAGKTTTDLKKWAAAPFTESEVVKTIKG